MFKLFRTFLLILFILSTTTSVYSESSWITKKSDKTKVELKKEKKEKKEKKKKWIAKKKEIKKNKEEFKKEEKKISKEVKSWITKKTKEKYIDSMDKLPDGAIYFTGASNITGLNFYGYVVQDTKSKLISNYYETSTGFGYFNDGKTICKIGSTVLIVLNGEVTARISGNCNNGLKFTGKTTQMLNSGWGSAKTADGTDRFDFDFNNDRTIIAEIFKKYEKTLITRQLPPRQNNKNIKLDPNGKYYALLIANSEYNNWDNLVSPYNDIREIKKVLDKSYKFEKILTVNNGTKKEIYQAFRNLSKLTTTNDYVLIYYSGHGKTKAEQAYWIPKDGSIEWGNGDWININELNIFLTEIKAHHLTVMVDSCYVGGKFKGTNILDLTNDEDRTLYGKNLEDGLNLRARSVLSSGSKGRVSDTVANTKHSLFALAFLNVLKASDQNSVPLNMLNVAIRIRGAFAGNYSQKPIYYHPDTWQDGGGDFIFIPKKNLQ